ncbi:general substrate transporter [Lactarius pseudohatsudake]|nr:general substrate transporter [Lactarius pseudohatsudake]
MLPDDYTVTTSAEADASSPLLPIPPSSARLHGGTLSVHPDGEHYSYAYGPTGLAGLCANTYTLRCAMFASIGGLTFGYDQGVIANVLVMKDFRTRWPVGPWELGLMTAVLELGCLFGFADRISRRTSIASACAVFCAGSALQTLARSLSQITGGRAIGGIGRWGTQVWPPCTLSPLYMAEISPPEVRGSLLALEQFSIVLGCVLGFWTGFLTRNITGSLSWRIPLGLQLVPGILLGLGVFALPDSPRLLVLHGKREAALASLAKLRLRSLAEARTDPLVQVRACSAYLDPYLTSKDRAYGNGSGGRHASKALAWARLFDRRYIDRTLIGIMVMFFQQWSGINALLYYGPLLMRSLGFDGSTVNLIMAGGVNIVQFLAVLPAILYIDTWGRRHLLRIGSVAMAVSHLLIALLIFEFGGQWGDHAAAAWVAVSCVYAFTVAYGTSFGPIGWVLPNEVFPLSMRGKGAALSAASNWLNNFFIGLVTPPLLESSPALTFGIFGSACFLAYLWATYVVPETANIPLEAIDELFRSPATQDDILMKKQVERELGLYDLMHGLTEDSSGESE